MEKTKFQKLMDALAKRTELCELHLGDIHTTEDLGKLAIATAADLKNFCVAEEVTMTKIAMVDLYHIIGMGELTPPQMMKFTYAMQEYLHYRPVIKAIAKYLNSIFELPKIPVATQYRLIGLEGITLTAGEGDPVEDAASVDDYNAAKKSIHGSTELPFQLEGSQIKVNMAQFEAFAAIVKSIYKVPISVDNFRQKIASKVEYLGINWNAYDGCEARGHIASSYRVEQFVKYYNSHK
jgi:hypothetical protein